MRRSLKVGKTRQYEGAHCTPLSLKKKDRIIISLDEFPRHCSGSQDTF
jgi:hypothetical protein